MATFDDATIGYPVCPDFGAEKRSAPKTRRTQFGDGYEQRTTFGLNQNPKEWSLTWVNLTTAHADAFEVFFNARAADSAAFDWSPPDDASTYKWVCPEWSRQLTAPGLVRIAATFRQVFEP